MSGFGCGINIQEGIVADEDLDVGKEFQLMKEIVSWLQEKYPEGWPSLLVAFMASEGLGNKFIGWFGSTGGCREQLETFMDDIGLPLDDDGIGEISRV